MDPRRFGPDDDDGTRNDEEWREPRDLDEWTEHDEKGRRMEAAARWDKLDQRIARIAFGWVLGSGPYYVNEQTKQPTGWYTDWKDGKRFQPTRKLSHAIGAAEHLATRRHVLPFSLTFDGRSGWTARFPHRPTDTVFVDADPVRAVWKAILKLDDDMPDPERAFRR